MSPSDLMANAVDNCDVCEWADGVFCRAGRYLGFAPDSRIPSPTGCPDGVIRNAGVLAAQAAEVFDNE